MVVVRTEEIAYINHLMNADFNMQTIMQNRVKLIPLSIWMGVIQYNNRKLFFSGTKVKENCLSSLAFRDEE